VTANAAAIVDDETKVSQVDDALQKRCGTQPRWTGGASYPVLPFEGIQELRSSILHQMPRPDRPRAGH
jgi:hypothetical protein